MKGGREEFWAVCKDLSCLAIGPSKDTEIGAACAWNIRQENPVVRSNSNIIQFTSKIPGI
jgi:hypothetical protein